MPPMLGSNSFVCTTCGRSYPLHSRDWRCKSGGLFDLEACPASDVADRSTQPGVWRYRRLLPLEPGCTCPCCSRFERRYLRHLFTVGEMLVARLLTLHNLHHYGSLTAGARQAIAAQRFQEFKAAWHEPLTGRESPPKEKP